MIDADVMQIATIVVLAWLAVGVAEVMWRIANGASPRSFFQNAFDEVVCVRWYLYALVGVLFAGVLACAVLSARGIWALFQCDDLAGTVDWSLTIWALYPLPIGAAALYVGLSVLRWIQRAEKNVAPSRVVIREISGELDDSEIADLGAEKFPNRIRPTTVRSVLTRVILLLATLTVAALAAFPELPRSLGVSALVDGAISSVTDLYVSDKLQPVGMWRAADMLIPYAATCLLILFTLTNTSYLYFSSATMAAMTAGLMLASLYSIVFIRDGGEIRLIIGVIFALPAVRIIIDLVNLARHTGRHSRIDPISAGLWNVFGRDLSALANTAVEAYQPVHEGGLAARIEQGAANVSREAFLAPPALGRYMRGVSVKWRRCATAISRFMTVARSVAKVNPRPTTEALRHPTVPLWNETLFPLVVPGGYVTLDDPVVLGSRYCVVEYCGRCGGSGIVACGGCGGSGTTTHTETRSETQYVNGKSVTVNATITYKRTCAGCGGSGRVRCGNCQGAGKIKYDQQLTTSWRADAIYAPYPEMTSHELIVKAEEFDFAKLRVIENRAGISEAASIFVSEKMVPDGLRERMAEARSSFVGWSNTICQLHGGTIYRAELTLSGFMMVCCSFRSVFRRRGWFFGHRPEFYFPKLPVDFATVGAFIMVPAMVALTVLWGAWTFSIQWDGAEKAAYDAARAISASQVR